MITFKHQSREKGLVKIRSDLVAGQNYGVYFNPNMREFCGKIAKISKILYDDRCNLDIDKGRWTWTREMFERK